MVVEMKCPFWGLEGANSLFSGSVIKYIMIIIHIYIYIYFFIYSIYTHIFLVSGSGGGGNHEKKSTCMRCRVAWGITSSF